jgi:hypothetical protein
LVIIELSAKRGLRPESVLYTALNRVFKVFTVKLTGTSSRKSADEEVCKKKGWLVMRNTSVKKHRNMQNEWKRSLVCR